MRDIRLTLLLLLAAGLSIAGCSSNAGRSPAAATAAPTTSAAAAVPSTGGSGPAPVALAPGGGLTPAFEDAVARRFAPQLRYTAYYNDGNTSKQNRNEDFFPMGVQSLLRELASGQARVVVLTGMHDDLPAVTASAPLTRSVQLTDVLDGYPRFMVGDAPGTAPLYTHVYEDPAQRRLAADRSGELVVYVEYFVFYAYDRSEIEVLGILPTPGSRDFTGHRGDWEHTGFSIRLRLGPGGVLSGGQVEEGTFHGHTKAYRADRRTLEFVDDAGQDDPLGDHPVVYVAQGKHASYPQAGEWHDPNTPAWVADHTDFFRGNGVWIDGWTVPLMNLERASANPAEFASAELFALIAASPSSVYTVNLSDWTQYRGRWGRDLQLGPLHVGLSPTGPKAKSSYGRFGGNHRSWIDAKRRYSRLTVYVDQGITIPRASPVPLPIR
ncbi:MAG: hypothetical protein KDD82_21930 [Planctomycetes bacterium]|nr:hypothetical protein [Planctomycetota bacterium]